jgi:formate dehydrogenase subunit gamma
MKIHLKNRSGKASLSFVWRAVLLLTVLLSLTNIGFLMAQGLILDTSQLLRNVLGGADYLRQTDLFISIRSSMIIPSFGIAILVFIGLSLGHFFTFGPKDMTGKGEADAIPWWNLFERIIHWIIAVSFVILLISGLLITFGRYFGGGAGTYYLRHLHEYSGFVFTPALVITVLMWIKESLPKFYDVQWLLHFGGYLGYKGQLKSGKFNAGQKQWYWIMTVTGVLLAWSGLGLFFQWGKMSELRFYVILHFFSSIPMILMFLVHLYMTTIGTKGSFMGMINGKMSKSAAESFHSESSTLS